MTSRELLQATLNHRSPDRVCVDFGATAVTGMHVSVVSRLRRAVLGDEGYRVKVVEPYQMLGEIDDELRNALGIDVAGIPSRTTMFGFENKGWKPFEMFDGTAVLVPEDFVTVADADGSLLIFPQGDTSVPPSGHMPKGGFFFDAIVRQEPLDEDALDPQDNIADFGLLCDEDVRHYAQWAQRLESTQCGVAFWMPGTGFGDIGQVPAPWLKHTKGVRDIAEWYISTAMRRDFVYAIFDAQCRMAERNIPLLASAIGDRADVALVSGTDFGTQRGPFIAMEAYRDLYKPFHVRVNRLIHALTPWKTMIHTCGAIWDFIPDFVEAGFDILNPVQTAAAGMDPAALKREFGKQVVFWGGGVDTQHEMASGTPDQVYRQVRQRINLFNQAGGFVFNAIHNVQANTPTENIMAMFRAIRDSGQQETIR